MLYILSFNQHWKLTPVLLTETMEILLISCTESRLDYKMSIKITVKLRSVMGAKSALSQGSLAKHKFLNSFIPLSTFKRAFLCIHWWWLQTIWALLPSHIYSCVVRVSEKFAIIHNICCGAGACLTKLDPLFCDKVVKIFLLDVCRLLPLCVWVHDVRIMHGG